MATRFSANEYVLFRGKSKDGIANSQSQDGPPAGSQRNRNFSTHLHPLRADPICTLLGDAKLNLRQPTRVTARGLMTTDVVTIRPEDSIKRIARVLEESGLRALPVVDGSGRLLGTITERGIAVKVIARGESLRKARVSDYMSSESFAC
jgi:signal-transduction protein with cAMP-binding, CBS, and nucleotidyltransferase domain